MFKNEIALGTEVNVALYVVIQKRALMNIPKIFVTLQFQVMKPEFICL